MAPGYLRFDFPADRALTDAEQRQIQDEVRGVVRADLPVVPKVMTMQEAIDGGADAFFDEKYGDVVGVGEAVALLRGTAARTSVR